MKYITLRINGMDRPIMFPDDISHFDVAQGICSRFKDAEQVSAGFVQCHLFYEYDDAVQVSGHSDSLLLRSRPEDADIIQQVIDMPVLPPPNHSGFTAITIKPKAYDTK